MGTLMLSSKEEKKEILDTGTFFLSGRKFHAKPFLTGKELKVFQQNVKKRRVFVNFIPRYITNAQLKVAFSKFGQIEDAFIITDIKRNNTSLGYGFIIFKNIYSAENAIRTRNMLMGDSTLQISSYQKGGTKNSPKPTLF